MGKKLVSIVCPVYNEEDNVQNFYNTIVKTIDSLGKTYNFEIIFTDNHSEDKTPQIIKKLIDSDIRVSYYRFSRNFGYQKSILYGYCKAKGDCAISFDCDLQDPPQMLSEFLSKWDKGYKVVYGIRKEREEGSFITFLRKVYYRTLNKISDQDLPVDVGDFMLLDRRILDLLQKVHEPSPYIRGIVFSLGFSRLGIPYKRQKRFSGTSKFTFGKSLTLALDGLVSCSVLPLRLASFVGIFIASVAIFMGIGYFVSKFFFNADWPRGFTTLTVLILFSISLNSLFLGLIGEYLYRMFQQGKSLTSVIVEEEGKSNEARKSRKSN